MTQDTKENCKELYEIIKEAKIYDFKTYDFEKKFPTDLYCNGMYLMYEKGEYVNNEKEQKRIVRVGINKKACIVKRLKTHRNGSIKRSIFRKHLYKIMESKKKIPKNVKDKIEFLEEKVSRYIKNKIKFIVVNDPENKRINLEKKIISTVAQFGERNNNSKWLGLKSANPVIREFGLWNVRHVRGSDYLQKKDLDYIKEHLHK